MKNLILFFFLFVSIKAFALPPVESCSTTPRENDSLTLVAIYNATDGDTWNIRTNWLIGPIDTWHGVYLKNNRVDSLVFYSNGLSGSLPGIIKNLDRLTYLDISMNPNLAGLPKEIGQLDKLTGLNICWVDLNSGIPEELWDLSHLEELIMMNNNLNAELPAGLFKLTNLRNLQIYDYQLGHPDLIFGTIPSSIGNLTKLEKLVLVLFGVDGSIPQEIGNLTELRELFFQFVNVSGELPKEIGNLSKLQKLRISGPENMAKTPIAGLVPDEIWSMQNLEEFSIQNTDISGYIPDRISNLKQLKFLDLRGNNFSGTIPDEIRTLDHLEKVRFDDNEFSDLPNLLTLPALSFISAKKNNLSFEDLEPNVNLFPNFNYYSPQALVGYPEDYQITAGQKLTLKIDVGGTNNIYQWYRNGVSIAGANKDSLELGHLLLSDSGTYTCKIRNSIVPGLTLTSHPKKVSVDAIPHYTRIWNGEINEPMVFYINQAKKNGLDMDPGDEIAIFDKGKCIGKAEVRGPLDGSNPLEIILSLDDESTPERDGYILGNRAQFKMWDNHTRRYFENVYAIEFLKGKNLEMYPGDTTIVNLLGCLNYDPIVSGIADQTINEGESFTSFNLDDHIIDEMPFEDITWTFEGNSQLAVEINDRIVTISTPNENWSGSETIIFTASDNGPCNAKFDSDTAVFSVLHINQPPVLDDIPDQSIAEGEQFNSIDLNSYVEDEETPDSEILWSYIGAEHISISIENGIATITLTDPDWSGSDAITFTASDNDPVNPLTASDEVILTRTIIYDPPVILSQQSLSTEEDTPLSLCTCKFDIDMLDADPEALSLHVEPGDNYTVNGTTVTPANNWSGILNVNVFVTDGILNSEVFTAQITVTPVNDSPAIRQIPDQSKVEGKVFEAINLDDFVEDIETPDSEISWSYAGAIDLTIQISADHIATITLPDENWNGSENITFTAVDNDPLVPGTASTQVTFTILPVNDAPVISVIPDQTILQGGSFNEINLDNYVTDPETNDEHISWSVSGEMNLSVNIVNRRASISITDSEWSGTEIITFLAQDNDPLEPLSSMTDVSFTVTPPNTLNASLEEQIWIYPNPATDKLNIKFGDHSSSEFTVEIRSTTGQLVLNEIGESYDSMVHTMSIERLQRGLYIVNIITNQGTIEYRLIKN